MGDTAQARFNAADDDWDMLKCLTTSLCIHHYCVIRALAGCPIGCISIVTADFSVRGITIDHGIHVPGSYPIEQIGFTEFLEITHIGPVGLRDDTDPEALCFQYPTNNSHAETGVIHIGIAADKDDIAGVPTQNIHLLPGNWQLYSGTKTPAPVRAVGKY